MGERTSTSSTLCCSSTRTLSSSISVPAGYSTVSVPGFSTSAATVRPSTRSPRPSTDVTTLDQRCHRQALDGAAIHLGHHQVLGDVDQAAGQVTGVGGLQRGVGQALAGAVRRDEVLLHVEAFTEVGRDRRLDDGSIGLGHQAAHAGQLADLRRAAARARVGHHEDGVERLLAVHLATGVLHVVGTELLHHRLGDLVVGTRPDVHHLVVALAVGDEARRVLVLDLLHFGGRRWRRS